MRAHVTTTRMKERPPEQQAQREFNYNRTSWTRDMNVSKDKTQRYQDPQLHIRYAPLPSPEGGQPEVREVQWTNLSVPAHLTSHQQAT